MKKYKITAQDIIDHLSANENRTKKVSEDFFKAFITTIEEALQNRDTVKIKDLGTFKLNWIAPRKSVNVQTGEQIIIDGYYKVAFTPENSLKKIINKPFEHLETVVLDLDREKNGDKDLSTPTEQINPMAALEEQANEIKNILNEIQEIPLNSEKKEEKSEEIIIVEPQNEVSKPSVAEQTKIDGRNEDIMKNVLHPFPTEKKKRNGLWITFLCLAVLFCGAISLYYAHRDFNKWVNMYVFNNVGAGTEYDNEASVFVEEEVISISPQEEQAQQMSDEWENIFKSRLKNTEYVATVKISSGGRLAYFAEKYYGSPHFWVYIYEANKDEISNPNFILQGTSIKIPKLDARLIDKDNPKSVEEAIKLEEFYSK